MFVVFGKVNTVEKLSKIVVRGHAHNANNVALSSDDYTVVDSST